MKKSFRKRMESLGLAAILTLSLCACGGDDGNGGTNSGNSGIGGSKKNPNAALAKENVYKFNEFVLPDMDADSYEVQASVMKDDTLYMILRTYNWGTEYTASKESNVLLSMKANGTDTKIIELEMPGEKNTQDAEGADIPSVLPQTVDVEAEAPASTDNMAIMPLEPGSNIWEDSYYSNYVIGNDGKVYATKNYWYENYTDPENPITKNTNYVSSWNEDGTFAWEIEIPSLQSEEEWCYISNMLVGQDGKVNLILSGDNAYTMEITQDAVGEKKRMPEEVSKIMSNVSDILLQADGSMLVLYYGEDDWSKMKATTFNPASNTIGESFDMPASFGWSGYQSLNTGTISDLIYSTYYGVYALKLGDTEGKLKMNFVNSDLNITNLMTLVELDANSFIGVFRENYDGEVKAGLFTYVAPADIPDKEVMVLGGSYVDDRIRQRVIEFNRGNEQYRIVIKDYSQYNSAENYNASTTKLNNDIITGQMPDILIASEEIPVENYISKGLLADIGAMIAADPELSQIEYVQNVFDAYKVNGKLYHIIPNFSVISMIGKTSIVGDRSSWTLTDMKELIKTFDSDTEIIAELTRSSFFNTAMQFCGADFVDVETGKCNFNSPAFIELMEFAKTLPEVLDDDYYGEDYWMTYSSRFRENKTILMQTSVYTLQNMNYVINGNFGEDVSFIGFPTSEGQGSYLSANETYAISARSLYPEGAWEFVRYYLTEKYQKENGYGMSTIKSILMEQAEAATGRPFYLDENGDKVEYDDYFWMNGEEIMLEPMKKEQVDKILNFVLSVDKTYYNNTEISNIINEEMEGFFSGQKSAQEVAAIIQSRAQIYVDENR